MKKSIETAQGSDVYPAAQQMLIHQGKVLKDATTLDENKVAENSFVVIMLSKVCVRLYAWVTPALLFLLFILAMNVRASKKMPYQFIIYNVWLGATQCYYLVEHES